jgi:hypothetical protein
MTPIGTYGHLRVLMTYAIEPLPYTYLIPGVFDGVSAQGQVFCPCYHGQFVLAVDFKEDVTALDVSPLYAGVCQFLFKHHYREAPNLINLNINFGGTCS